MSELVKQYNLNYTFSYDGTEEKEREIASLMARNEVAKAKDIIKREHIGLFCGIEFAVTLIFGLFYLLWGIPSRFTLAVNLPFISLYAIATGATVKLMLKWYKKETQLTPVYNEALLSLQKQTESHLNALSDSPSWNDTNMSEIDRFDFNQVRDDVTTLMNTAQSDINTYTMTDSDKIQKLSSVVELQELVDNLQMVLDEMKRLDKVRAETIRRGEFENLTVIDSLSRLEEAAENNRVYADHAEKVVKELEGKH